MTDMEIGTIEGVRIVRPNPLTLAAMRACCHDAQWAYTHRDDMLVRAKCVADPRYREVMDRYVLLGRYLVTGKP